MARIGITETVLRDAHQSLIATRMTTEEMLPVLEKLDEVGYHSLEVWGGATFDSCLRFLDEDPWERLRIIRSRVKKTKLQMLLRGQNILAYKHYADDVVEYFVQKSVANGIDVVRIFDALNDVRNIETAIKACKKEGGHAQAAFSYTISPVHSIEHFVKVAKIMEEMGADSICIKDMAGLLLPYAADELVKALKENIKVPIQLHTHYFAGVASMTYIKAIEAGVDVVDCAISPLSLGTSQPPTEPLVATLKNTPYDTGLDLDLLSEIADYFRSLKDKYLESGLLDTKVMGVDVNALKYQIPGGMLSNMVSQLKQSNAMDKYNEVLKEVPRVREDFGFPPLVTPTSQIVGTQAVLNVVMGERYKMVPKESKALVKGEYGKTPAPIPEEITKKILGDEQPITCRPADLIAPELENIKEQVKEWMEQEEDVLSYALFPQVAETFFKRRAEKRKGPEDNPPEEKKETLKEEEVLAAISATVVSMETRPGYRLVVRDYKRLPQTAPVWNTAGRL
ncbi:MAG: oxaloacetate decarboxylase subunit alpha [Clostridiales bacterium]|jgi:oxaloacetate decarboxylase alpha subunit|nr:oxaloacetate decarboxylase subunit alpha [Eubacteriales bacterium]MDH7565360.1 oxaloacetate decarboxylase subunit alpha [Clostridiales bacterium]